MRFFEQFGVTSKELGKTRSSYIKKIEKALGKHLLFHSAYFPLVPEEEKRHGLARLLGETDAELHTGRLLIFNAEVIEQPFRNLIGLLAPFETKHRHWVEYSYMTLLPVRIESAAAYVQKQGALGGRKRAFFPLNISINELNITEDNVPIDEKSITEETLLKSDGPPSPAFTLPILLHRMRMDGIVRQDLDQVIKEKQQSRLSTHLNAQKKLLNHFKKFLPIYELKIVVAGIKFREGPSLGLTVVLIPVGYKTLVQVADYRLTPKQAFTALKLLASSLRYYSPFRR